MADVLAIPKRVSVDYPTVNQVKIIRLVSADDNLKSGMPVALDGNMDATGERATAVIANPRDPDLCEVVGFAYHGGEANHQGFAEDIVSGRAFDCVVSGPMYGWTALSVGRYYYLRADGATPTGEIGLFADIPTGGTDYIVPIGKATSPNEINVQAPNGPSTLNFPIKA